MEAPTKPVAPVICRREKSQSVAHSLGLVLTATSSDTEKTAPSTPDTAPGANARHTRTLASLPRTEHYEDALKVRTL